MNSGGFRLSEYDETIRGVLDSGGEFRIYPRGTSMLPLLRQGKDSVVLVKPGGELRRGDIAFYRRKNGQYVLHRVIKTGGSYTLCGDNQLEPESGITREMVIGVVSAVYRGEKKARGLGYRVYLLLWRSFFIRRVYFRLRRIFHGKKEQ